MKKVLCFLLALSLLCSVLVFGTQAASQADPLKLIVASDLHWRKDSEVHSQRFFHPRESLGQVSAISPLIVDRFLQDAAASDADFLLLTGDLTDMGNVQDSTAFAAVLASFEAQTGKQIFVINGNHDLDMQDDVPSYSMDHVQFREIYHQFGYDEALAVDEATSSYAVDLKNGYRLLALNSNEWNGNGSGAISDALLEWVTSQVETAQKDGKKIIVMMHHELMEHYTLEVTMDDFYTVKNYKQLCRLFDKWNIRVTFTGHHHLNDVAVYEGVHRIYDVNTSSLSSYPLTYRYVTLTDKDVVLEGRTIDKLDITNIAPGYSDAQKDMIANDPVGYSLGCLEDSLIEDYIRGFVNAEQLIDTLGLAPDNFLAKAIKRILPENILIPLYGEGETVEAKAKALGYTLPESDYETVGALITAFYAGLARGDENLGGNSPEGRLVLDAVYALLAARAAEESPFIQTLLSSKLAARLGLKMVNNLFTRGALDLILTGLMIDKAPGDCNVTLPGYGKGADNPARRAADAFRVVLNFFRLPALFGRS